MFYEKYFNLLLLVLSLSVIASLPFVSFSAIAGASFGTAALAKFLIVCVAGAIAFECFSNYREE